MKGELEILGVTTVHSLPGIWSPAELRNLLLQLEFPDADSVGDDDVLEMALMALQDVGHQMAGEAVLETVFGNSMKSGVRQNLVDDLQDDEPWQDFSNVLQQKGIFIAVALMYQAFPNRYPNPDAVRLELAVRGIESSALDNVALIRFLSRAMPPTGVIRRLYGTVLERGDFQDAEGMVWYRETQVNGILSIISSRQWLGSLEKGARVAFRLPEH